MTILELQKKRAGMVADAGKILKAADDQQRGLTKTETETFDRLHAEAKAIESRIEAEKRQGDVQRDLNSLATMPIKPGTPGTGNATDGPEVFGKDQEGRLIHSLDRRHSFADYVRRSGRATKEYPGLSFGGFIRAAVRGPRNEVETRALSEGTLSAGGYTVPVELASEFIDNLRAQSTVLKAGARTIPLNTQTTKVARLTGDIAFGWKAENAAITPSDATFDAVAFTVKTCAALQVMSVELFEDSSNIDQMLLNALSAAAAAELDRVALLGNGTTEPNGLVNQSGVGSVSFGTNGAAPTDYTQIVSGVQTILDANGPFPTAAIMANRTWARYASLKDTTGQAMRVPPALQPLQWLSTSKIPVNDTQGSSNLASKMYLGDFSNLWLGIRDTVKINFLRETYAGNLQYGLACYFRADVQCAHGAAFAKLIGIL